MFSWKNTLIAFFVLFATDTQAAINYSGSNQLTTLYCDGFLSPPEQKNNDQIPSNAIVSISGNHVSLEIRMLGSGAAVDAKNLSGFEVGGSLLMKSYSENISPFKVAFVIQKYSGELKVYLLDDKPGEQEAMFQGVCVKKEPLLDLHG